MPASLLLTTALTLGLERVDVNALIRAGMGKGVPVGVISHLLVQVKGELEEAVRQAREAGVSEEAIRPALEGLEAIKATQSDES